MDYRQFSLEEQVAQLFMVGYSGAEPNPITHRFLERGVGGLIFFRDNFDSLQSQSPQMVADLLKRLSAAIPAHLPRPLMGIDQEGGQVERLPHTVFPTALTPGAVSLSADPEGLAADMYAMLARQLVALGFNLNFFPTLDVNLNRQNPIIGVRSFGDDPQMVWRLGQIAMRAFEDAGLIAVGKHFPGHGDGTVDSHLDLPTLNFSQDELQPFQKAVEAGLPVMLVAHGYYPTLQTTEFEKTVPSSASSAIIQGLLRQQCGFEGVVITDDMCMGAITRHCSPVEAALASLKAGVDILLYKQSTEDEWAVYQAVVSAFQSGELPMLQLYQSLERIARLKAQYLQSSSNPAHLQLPDVDVRQKQADDIARRGIGVLYGDAGILPIASEAPLLLIHPERERMGNYAFDVPTSPSFDLLLRQQGFAQLESLAYPPTGAFDVQAMMQSIQTRPEVICLVTFNPLIHQAQASLYQALKAAYPDARVIIASAGTAYDRDAMAAPDLHLSLCSYRPATMRALTQAMKDGLAASAAPLSTAATERLSGRP